MLINAFNFNTNAASLLNSVFLNSGKNFKKISLLLDFNQNHNLTCPSKPALKSFTDKRPLLRNVFFILRLNQIMTFNII